MARLLGQTCLSIQSHTQFCHTDHYIPVLSWPVVLDAGEHDRCTKSAAAHSDLLGSALTSLVSVFWYHVCNVIFVRMPSSAASVHRSVWPCLWILLLPCSQSCIGNKRQLSLGYQHSLKDTWYHLQTDNSTSFTYIQVEEIRLSHSWLDRMTESASCTGTSHGQPLIPNCGPSQTTMYSL